MYKQCNLSIMNHICRLWKIQSAWEFIPLCAQSDPTPVFPTKAFIYDAPSCRQRSFTSLIVDTSGSQSPGKNPLGMKTAMLQPLARWLGENPLQFQAGKRLGFLRALHKQLLPGALQLSQHSSHPREWLGMGPFVLCYLWNVPGEGQAAVKCSSLLLGCWSTACGIPGVCSWRLQRLSAPWKGRKWQTLNNKFSLMLFAIFTTHFRINERLTQKKVLKVHAQ